MNILIICYCYPPELGPRASRWSAIAEYWAAQGHQIHVISGGIPGALSEETLNGVQVHRMGETIIEKLWSWLKKEPPQLATESAGKSSSSRRLGSFIKTVHDLTWKNIYWPESNCLWFLPARTKALKLTTDILFDAVISTSTPYSGHLVGKAVKKAHPGVPWTVDIGDPFSFGQPSWNNTGLYKGLNHRSEAKVLNAADSISVTVDSCKKSYGQLFPGVEDKITVIPPLFSGVIPSYQKKTKPQKRRRLVFTGSLYKEIRNPAYLLKLLSYVFEQDPETEAHFYGRTNDCANLFKPYLSMYPKNIFIHGLVDRTMAAAALKKADILINISNRTRFQLPSKLVDYIASGKPIINITSIEDDCSISFLNSYTMSETFTEWPSENIHDDLIRIYRFIKESKDTPQHEIDYLLKPFLISTVEAQYQNMIYKLAPNSTLVTKK